MAIQLIFFAVLNTVTMYFFVVMVLKEKYSLLGFFRLFRVNHNFLKRTLHMPGFATILTSIAILATFFIWMQQPILSKSPKTNELISPLSTFQPIAETKEVQTVNLKEVINLHKVVVGENLWSISKQYYGSGAEWRLIADTNRDKIQPESNIVETGIILNIPDNNTKN